MIFSVLIWYPLIWAGGPGSGSETTNNIFDHNF
jgi:hypothetical protein